MGEEAANPLPNLGGHLGVPDAQGVKDRREARPLRTIEAQGRIVGQWGAGLREGAGLEGEEESADRGRRRVVVHEACPVETDLASLAIHDVADRRASSEAAVHVRSTGDQTERVEHGRLSRVVWPGERVQGGQGELEIHQRPEADDSDRLNHVRHCKSPAGPEGWTDKPPTSTSYKSSSNSVIGVA